MLTHRSVAELRPAFAPLAAVLARRHRLDPQELEQGVWLRACERAAGGGLPGDARSWLRGQTLHECRRLTRTADRERAVRSPAGRPGPAPSAEQQVLAAGRRRTVRAAVAALPGRCPELLAALAGAPDLTYRELAVLLGMPRGSIGPTRSRCLACLRTLLHGLRA
ncbi:RNA polymerase sigma factor [Kitasatospora sp. NPDC057223]|uniref:RNA polymerase sigma factor n=1 Tax=Kitasatospora sp. NPDC057223 TaxID=3346055 RepID=UPI003640D3AC